MNSFPYDKKEDAEAAAKDATNNYDPKFCPMINDFCRKDCMSFVDATVRSSFAKNRGQVWGIVWPTCCNSMVTGYIEFTPE